MPAHASTRAQAPRGTGALPSHPPGVSTSVTSSSSRLSHCAHSNLDRKPEPNWAEAEGGKQAGRKEGHVRGQQHGHAQRLQLRPARATAGCRRHRRSRPGQRTCERPVKGLSGWTTRVLPGVRRSSGPCMTTTNLSGEVVERHTGVQGPYDPCVHQLANPRRPLPLAQPSAPPCPQPRPCLSVVGSGPMWMPG